MTPLRPPHRPGAAGRRPRRCAARLPRRAHDARPLLAGRTRAALSSPRTSLWQTLDGGQTGPKSVPTSRARPGSPANIGVYRGAHRAAPTQARRHLYLAPSPLDEPHLGRHRRRPHPHHPRRRPTLDHVTPPELGPWVKVSLLDASQVRRAHRLRRHEHHPPRRPAPPHLPHPRRRQDWAQIVDGHPRRRHHRRRARGSRSARPALRRHGAAGVRLVRRRRPLAVAAPQHAGDVIATSSSRATISSPAPTAAASGSSTTSRRSVRSPPARSRRGASLQAADARRVRWNMNTDTPLPPDEPAGQQSSRRRRR